ncbi:uncharacterized protein LOC119952411 isoform X1 [Scyliorhinus canicula]|uniref:uncharacterized protein LOC119952411 isoform X1 n=1 Tax=Scyliorhinus canicula TaxID=7830 RepID=UPI0018F3B2CA|nr:uncharacterized protein LOC119952411 isoform X1 [Scyliorhinus canicula]
MWEIRRFFDPHDPARPDPVGLNRRPDFDLETEEARQVGPTWLEARRSIQSAQPGIHPHGPIRLVSEGTAQCPDPPDRETEEDRRVGSTRPRSRPNLGSIRPGAPDQPDPERPCQGPEHNVTIPKAVKTTREDPNTLKGRPHHVEPQGLTAPQKCPPGDPEIATGAQDPSRPDNLPSTRSDVSPQIPRPLKSSNPPRKRGKRGGLQVRLKQHGFKSPLPSIFLANIQDIESKLDELKTRLTSQREVRDSCVLCFTETWLTPASLDCAIQPDGFSIHRMDRMASSGKTEGGGVCLLINNSWCSDVATLATHCSPDLEYLIVKCCPDHLPQEFTSVIIMAVYIPPEAEVKNALDELSTAVNKNETEYTEAFFIMAGDFNQANLKSVLPKFHQHISCPTKGPDILDHCYTNIKGAYRSIARPHFGNSDHKTVFLLPAYKQTV